MRRSNGRRGVDTPENHSFYPSSQGVGQPPRRPGRPASNDSARFARRRACTIGGSKSVPENRKGKAYADRRRRAWVDDVGAPRYLISSWVGEGADVEGRPLDARMWGTRDAKIVLLPFATEDSARSDHWFVGVQDDIGEDAVIVLCEQSHSDTIHAIELFNDFIEQFWTRLTRGSDGEIRINIERKRGLFFVRMPNADPVQVRTFEAVVPRH